MIHCPECGKLMSKYTSKQESNNITVVLLKCQCGKIWGYSYKVEGNLIEFTDMLVRVQ